MSTELTVSNAGLLKPDEFDNWMGHARMFMASGLCPARFKNPEAVVITALYGRDLGLNFTSSLSEIHVINGVPGASAKCQMAVIKKREPECKIKIIEQGPKQALISIQRKGEEEPQNFSYTIEEAQQAGLTSKDVWKKYPTDLLTARALTRGFRSTCGDLITGFGYTPEELEDIKPAFDAGKISKPGGMPKKGDKKPEPEVTDVESEVVETPAETPQEDRTFTEEESKVNKRALKKLEGELHSTTEKGILDMIHDNFRAEHSKDGATLAEGYELYQKRLTEQLKGEESNG